MLDRLHQSGAMKVLFPRGPRLEAVLVNTSGGLTGGDRIEVRADAGTGSAMTLTTQAAERVYRSAGGCARVRTRLSAEAGATLFWLPQETILFDGCALHRSLTVELAPTARLLLVEPLIFGRAAMGEKLHRIEFRDEIVISRDGAPLYTDRLRLGGSAADLLARPAIAGGCGAAVSLIFVAPDAEAHLAPVRAALPDTGGASLLGPDVLAVRAVARDGFELRRHLLPILDRLSHNTLPRAWRL